MTYHEIIASLPQLTPDELRQLKLAVAAYASIQGGNDPPPPKTNDYVLDVVHQFCVGHGIGGYFKQLQTTAKEPAVREKLVMIHEFLDGQVPTKQDRMVLLRIGLDLLYNDLGWMTVPITGSVLLRHLHRMPAALDRAFPGYARHRMLKCIVQL